MKNPLALLRTNRNLPARIEDVRPPWYRRLRRMFLTPAPERGITPEALPFQSDIDELIEEAPPQLLRSLNYIIIALIAVMILIASLADIDMVVVGPGRLTTDTPPMVLQPIRLSIIKELNVKPGDVVTKGEVLAKLDPTFTQADLSSLTAQQRSLQAQIRRQEAELKNKPLEPGEQAGPDDLLQFTLYTQRKAQYASRLRSFDEDIERLQAGIRTAENDRVLLQKQLGIAQDVETMRGTLYRAQTGSKLMYLDAQASRMRMEREYQDTVNRLTEMRHSLQSRQAERQTFIDEWRRLILEEMVKLRNDSARIGEELSKAALVRELVTITAPEDGVVLEVAKLSVGSVAREAEPLVTLIPSRVPLIADIAIASGEIGYTKPGDKVEVKVDAFSYQQHGMLEGRLRSISEESYASGAGGNGSGGASPRPASGGAVHRAQVELTKTTLDRMPEGARLIPGMTVNAEIKVGLRRVISYFIYPITRGFHESIREP